MAIREEFTAEQWQLLLDIPTAVGTAVMVAGASGIGSMKEALVLASATLTAQGKFAGCELVEALLDARVKGGQRSNFESLNSPYRGMSPEEILEDVLVMCGEVSRLLQAKVGEEVAGEFKSWVIDVGTRVAAAAKEGGFLGLGGERISSEERKVLSAVKEALGL